MGELLGRFHPLIVHLPIGILIAAFLMELASRRTSLSHLKKSIPFVLLMGIASASLALFTGWIMPKEGEFSERLVGLHLWFSVGVTACSILVYYLSRSTNEGKRKFYFPLFVLTMILLAITGHYGGSLTHGEDHLTQALEEHNKPVVTDVNSMLVYQDLAQPLLKQKCYSCHNEGKKKGGLDMSSIQSLKKGGDGGLVLLANSTEGSPLIQRLHLPLEDKEHMPPKGKKQLSHNEVALLEWWVTQGTPFEKTVGSISQSAEITKILKSYEQGTESVMTKNLDKVTAKQISKLAAVGISVIPQNSDSPLVNVSFSRDTLLTKAKLKKLKAISKNISDLDLSYTNVDDRMLSVISKCKHLQRLKLQNTKVSSHGLKNLEKLQLLNYLNLYGCKVDDEGFRSLEKMKGLKNLFLWQTQVSDERVADYENDYPLVMVNYKIDPSLFGDARLKPPIISADKDIFEDTISVAMSLNFKNVAVYYTLDGSEPDSTSSVYDAPFVINKTAVVKAISAKEGWISSEVAEKVITKAGYKVVSLKLQKAPNEKYKAGGAKSLIDFKKGTTTFVDDNWLGYEAEHMTATLDLGTKESVSNVIVGALEETGSYIFFPKAIEVRTSLDGRHFDLTHKLSIPISKGPEPAKLKSFLLNFEATEARYLKVKVLGTLKNPEWHAAPGAKNWIFIDEILVN